MTHRSLLPFAICILVGLLGLLPAAADDQSVTLLLKCKAGDVEAVRAALEGLEVELYDIETMQPVSPADTPAPPPRLPDAAKLMRHLLAIATTPGETETKPPVLLEVLDVREDRLRARLQVQDVAYVDRLSAAILADSAIARRFGPSPLRVATKAAKNGTWQADLHLRLDVEPGEAPLPTGPIDGIGYGRLHELLTQSGMRLVAAGANRREDHGAVATIRREMSFEATTTDKLSRFLELLGAEPYVTVTEISWKLSDPARDPTAIAKPTIEIAWRTRKAE